MVYESFDSGPSSHIVRSFSNSYTVPGSVHVSKSQRGYRTTKMSPTEYRALRKASVSGNIVSILDAYDRECFSYRQSPSREFLVNDRDYREITCNDALPTYSGYGVYDPGDPLPDVRFTNSGVIAPGMRENLFPALPPDSETASWAGGRMRSMSPNRAEIDLARSLGEMKDYPRLARASSYVPRGPNFLGSAYLNVVFGILPTYRDIASAAEMVIESEDTVNNYLAQEKARIRKTMSETIWSASDGGLKRGKASAFRQLDAPYDIGGFPCRVSKLLHSGIATRSDIIVPTIHWSWWAERVRKAFATFEFFIPKPQGVEGRLQRYAKSARALLGSGVTASTVYDLTPYSWMVDWFIDVGGLLRYQQNVADNQTVASRAGWTTTDFLTFSAQMSVEIDKTGVSSPRNVVFDFSPGGSATVVYRNVHRRRGNPYSMSPNWDLSPQQLAITAAMGLSHLPGRF